MTWLVVAIPHLTYQPDPPPRSLCLFLHHKRVGLFTRSRKWAPLLLPFYNFLEAKNISSKNNDSFSIYLVMSLSLAQSFLRVLSIPSLPKKCRFLSWQHWELVRWYVKKFHFRSMSTIFFLICWKSLITSKSCICASREKRERRQQLFYVSHKSSQMLSVSTIHS